MNNVNWYRTVSRPFRFAMDGAQHNVYLSFNKLYLCLVPSLNCINFGAMHFPPAFAFILAHELAVKLTYKELYPYTYLLRWRATALRQSS